MSEQDFAELAAKLHTNARITVLTGAGVSAASGVPTFRGPEGIWKNGILLIPAIRFLPLLPPRLSPAFLTAVRLSSVAPPVDKKHLSTPGRTAEQLSKRNFPRHCSRAEWTMAAARGKLNPHSRAARGTDPICENCFSTW